MVKVIRDYSTKLLAFLLWILSFGLGLLAIYSLREICLFIFAQFSTSWAPAAFGVDMIVWVSGIIFLIFLLISTEYHMKHVGQPASWRLFATTLGIEILIAVIAYFMGVEI